MGNRVSISFRSNEEESVALFNHWGGMAFVEEANAYVADLKQWRTTQTGVSGPLDRLEPSTVLVDFIRHATTRLRRVTGGLYLGAHCGDGDNSDNGHHAIDLA